MNSARWTMLMMLAMVMLGMMSGCASKESQTSPGEFIHFVDVYINQEMKYVTLENDQEIGTLLVFPGDYLYINNLTQDKVVIDLAPGVFATSELQVAIAGNKRVKLLVLKEAVVAGSFKSTKDGGPTIDGSPKVKVGEEP